MNHDHPHDPLTMPQAMKLIDDACEFSAELPADEREIFLRNVVVALAGSLFEAVQG